MYPFADCGIKFPLGSSSLDDFFSGLKCEDMSESARVFPNPLSNTKWIVNRIVYHSALFFPLKIPHIKLMFMLVEFYY